MAGPRHSDEASIRAYMTHQFDRVEAALKDNDADGVRAVYRDMCADGYGEAASHMLNALIAAGLRNWADRVEREGY